MKNRLLFLISLILVAVSCNSPIDPFEETDEGKNVLGFYLNGEKIRYATMGGFPSEYPYEHCVYAKQLNTTPDSLEISAKLANNYYQYISIKIALSDIRTDKVIKDPDITLTYFYKKLPLPPSEYSEGGVSVYLSDTDFVSGNLSFRKWDQQVGILSGNFSFDCTATQHDGSVKRISVTKGTFDVRIDK